VRQLRYTLNTSVFVALCLVLTACDGLIDTPAVPELNVTSADSAAALWQPIYVDSIDVTGLPDPSDPQEGLDEVRTLAGSNTSIRTWNVGAVQAWTEITCKMVAKYNVAPFAERAPDGRYTGRFLPDPQKPFTSPPFAARLYAMISVAQYDALIHTWRLKYTANRPEPATADASIRRAAPGVAMPSWPNADAVVARATVEILATLYPGERATLESLYKEAVDSRIAAGIARRSDVIAGDSIGKRVALRVLQRAQTDKFSAADDQPRWRRVEPTIVTTWPRWACEENPLRPPMLPFFGEVLPWHVADISKVDPGPPPSESDPIFKRDLDEMRSINDNRTREQVRIAAFWEDGAGTATPPGHWMRIAVEQTRSSGLSPVRSARVLAYLATSQHDAAVAAWHTKYRYITARPCTVDPSLRMSAGLPNFPGYTSGHSTFSSAAAEVLSHFFPTQRASYMAMADEAAESRIYSRIHMRIDCEVGKQQGQAVGVAAVQRAQGDAAE